MRFFFLKYFLVAGLFCLFFSCKNQEKEKAKTSAEKIKEIEKSYHEKYLEEIAAIEERDSVSTSGMLIDQFGIKRFRSEDAPLKSLTARAIS